jgi:hypothetical protein
MTTTKRDLQALQYLAQRLREETPGAGKWHDNGLTAVLSKLEGHNLAITIERVTRHAADADAKTPGAIERPFVPEATVPGPPRPPKPHEVCRLCGRAMHGVDVVCDTPTARPLPKNPPTDAYLQARRATKTEETP